MKALAVAAVLTLAAASAGAQVTVYSNDFDAASTASFTGPVSTRTVDSPGACASAIINCNGRFLSSSNGDPFTNETFGLSLSGLATHTGLRISFVYMTLNSMDGDSFGPDGFQLSLDGTTLINATFANYSGNVQSYCPATTSPCARHTGAAQVDNVGFNAFGATSPSALYTFSFDLAHTANTATYEFITRINQSWSDEGMGFDNVTVQALGTTATTTPEPSTYLLLGSGLATLAGVARRRRRAA